MKRVGILTISDGREYLNNEHKGMLLRYQSEIARELEDTGEFEVVAGRIAIHTNEEAKAEAKRLQERSVEMTIFNYAIWCYPQYTAVACNFAPGPYLLFCNLHPSECGMVGMLAAAGTLDQLGISYKRLWGSIHEEDVKKKMISYLRAGIAVKRLKGLTFGNFGGRPLGMYTAVANLEQWQREFGIDIENIEQEDIVREGEMMPEEELSRAFQWLTERVREVAYDQNALTEEKLKLQLRSYYGLRSLVKKRGLDFVGIKAHGDLTDHYVTMDVAEALLNDPYDWNGPKEPVVAATESDMDGALTMQLFKEITGMPVLFADVRHYDKERDVWYFSNSGTHATYFAAGSMVPEENLKEVTLYPEVDDYPAGGASVHHFAKAGKVTLARLARKKGTYYMTIVPAEFVSFDRNEALAMGATITPVWPVAFAKLEVSAERFLNEYPCNHIHGVYGDYVEELKAAADVMGMEYVILEPR